MLFDTIAVLEERKKLNENVPTLAEELRVHVKAMFANIGLNERQLEAAYATFAHRIVLIQGPPGTGKTRVSCAVLQAQEMISKHMYRDKGSKVAFHAHANNALDVLGKRLVESGSIAFRAGAAATRDSVGVYSAILIPQEIKGNRGSVQYVLLEAKGWTPHKPKRLNDCLACLLAGTHVKGKEDNGLFHRSLGSRRHQSGGTPRLACRHDEHHKRLAEA